MAEEGAAGGDKKWSPAAERDLCAAILSTLDKAPRPAWARVTTAMATLGHSFTESAVSQRFSKVIMKDVKARLGEPDPAPINNAEDGTGSKPSTPRKPAGSGTGTGSVRKRRGRKAADDEDGGSAKKAKVGAEVETPTKAKPDAEVDGETEGAACAA